MTKRPVPDEQDEQEDREGAAAPRSPRRIRLGTDEINLLFEMAPDAYYLNDMLGNFIEGNKAAEELVGYKRDELIGKNFLQLGLIRPRDLPRAASMLAANVAGRTVGPDELTLIRKDGTPVTVEVRAQPISFRGKRVVLGIARDITKRKKAERALLQAQEELETRVQERTIELAKAVIALQKEIAERKLVEKALSQESERIQAVISQTADCIYLADVRTRKILEHNPALTRLLGYTDSELSELTLYDFIDHDRESIDRNISRIAADREHFIGERRYRRRDGTTAQMSVSANLISYGGREVICVVSRDVTELMRLEEQLRWSQRMEAVGRLAAGIAHDFNNVLSVISLCCEVISIKVSGQDQDLRSNLDDVMMAIQRATQLIQQLQAFSRRQTLEPTTVTVNALIEDLTRMTERILGRKIHLVTELDQEIGQVLADPGQIEQVLMNLVVNARDAISEGGTITIRSEELTFNPKRVLGEDAPPGRYICITVIDTGCGIDVKTLDHIFEPFYTTKEEGKGTGLGLAVAYGIVKQHKGFITVRSKLDEGTTFQVYLPVKEE